MSADEAVMNDYPRRRGQGTENPGRVRLQGWSSRRFRHFHEDQKNQKNIEYVNGFDAAFTWSIGARRRWLF